MPAGDHRRYFDTISAKINPPAKKDDCARFILEVMEGCEKLAKGSSSGQLGRFRGDWFEWSIAECLKAAFGKGSYQTKDEIGTKDIDGFEFEDWIPGPDIIVKDSHNLKAVLSAKWGLRPDRRYEEPYVATAMKRIVPSVKYLVVTNDPSTQNIQMLVDSREVDRVYHVRREVLAPSIQGRLHSLADLISDLALLLRVESKLQ